MYTDISDNELVQYHKKINVNKSFNLEDILDDNPLFLVKQHATNVYKIVPLFNCETISSTNPQDRIFGNQMLICIDDADTIINFITNKAFEDFQILTNTVEKWGKTIHYGVVYEKTQNTPIHGANVTIEIINDDNVDSTISMGTNGNGEFVHFITGSYDHIRTVVTYEGITHTDEV